MKNTNKHNMTRTTLLTLPLLLAACTHHPHNILNTTNPAPIWPDYADVTIPPDIAPLNISALNADAIHVTLQSPTGNTLTSQGNATDFNINQWQKLLANSIGQHITVSVLSLLNGQWYQHPNFQIHVSTDSIADYGITYRKIAPGYETYSDIGIYQRDLHSFSEQPIITHTLLPGQCMCCHTPNQANPDNLTIHFRGSHPATLIQQTNNGETSQQWLTTTTDSTLCNCMYPYWHPSGRFCAYSLNKVNQCFLTAHDKFIEVFDQASDICVLDTDNNQLILSPHLQTQQLETWPAFSPDGKTLFYCSAQPQPLPAQADKIHYDLRSITFNPDSASFGTNTKTIIHHDTLSISLPRPSYNGRFIVYCLANYGCFPINHPEADLYIYDLHTQQSKPLSAANSADTESFHNWNSNSHWLLFSSRRHDSLTSLVYFTHIDNNGNATKPFLLPQRDPLNFYTLSLHSFNTPDFTSSKVNINPRKTYNNIFSNKRTQVTIKH